MSLARKWPRPDPATHHLITGFTVIHFPAERGGLKFFLLILFLRMVGHRPRRDLVVHLLRALEHRVPCLLMTTTAQSENLQLAIASAHPQPTTDPRTTF
jgi:hypothetical protein